MKRIQISKLYLDINGSVSKTLSQLNIFNQKYLLFILIKNLAIINGEYIIQIHSNEINNFFPMVIISFFVITKCQFSRILLCRINWSVKITRREQQNHTEGVIKFVNISSQWFISHDRFIMVFALLEKYTKGPKVEISSTWRRPRLI